MKKLLFFFAMAIVLAMQLPAQETVVIGDTLTTTQSNYYPINDYFRHSFSATIYRADELQPGSIHSVSLYHEGTPYNEGTYKVYMKSVTENEMPYSGLPSGGWVEVFNDTITQNPGWVTFELTTPFVYTGEENLAVSIIRTGTSYENYHYFKYTSTPWTSVSYTYDDQSSYDITSLPSYLQSTTNRPVTKFEISALEGYCFAPSDLTVSSVGQDEATLTWSEYNEGSTFGISYRLSTEEAWTELSSSVNDTTYTISGLSPYTRYEVKVWTICEDGISTERETSFITLPSSDNYIVLPYEQNFDDLANLSALEYWTVTNNGTNQWYLGTLGAKLESEDDAGNGLYISNDGGESNNYSHVSMSTHLSALLNIEEGNYYTIAFDYRAVGELSYDEVVVSLYPIGESLPVDQYINSSYKIGSTYSNSGEWTRVSIEVPMNINPSVYQLVLSWRNDGSGGYNPAASIDNISITSTSCARVNDFEYAMVDAGESVTMNITVNDELNEGAEYLLEYRLSGDTTWSSVQSASPVAVTGLPYSTLVEYRVTASCAGEVASVSDVFTAWTICSSISEFPYVVDFETSEFIAPQDDTKGNGVAPHCWFNVNGGYPYYYWSGLASIDGVDGSKALSFYGSAYSYSYDFSEWFISPIFELTGNERLNFEYKITTTSNAPVIDVLVINTEENDYASMADTANFTLVSSINTAGLATNQYNMAEIMLNEYTGSYRVALAVRQYSSSFYVDNFSISEIPACPEVYGLSATAVSDESIAITYSTANILETGVVIAYSEISESTTEFDPATASTVIIPADTELPYILEGLTPGTSYYVAAAQNCGGEFTAPVVATTPMVYTVPFYSDFDTPATTAVVSKQTNSNNAWVIGSAANNTEDEYGDLTAGGAMYISTDGGLTFSYNIGANTFAYAKIPIEFSTDSEYLQYDISFDYTAGGESNESTAWDYMSVFLAPESVEIPANAEMSSSYAIVSKISKTNNAWLHHSSTVANLEGVYNLIFMFKCDGGGGVQPSVAIDNLSISGSNCSGAVVDASVGFVEGETNTLVLNLSDTENEGATYTVSYAPQGGTATEVTGLTLSDFPYLLAENVALSSVHQVEVSIVCPDGSESDVMTTTITLPSCASVPAPWSEDFTTDPFTSNCWERYVGLLPESGVISTSVMGTSQTWSQYTRTFNETSVVGVRANVYGNNQSCWFMTPNINLGTDGNVVYQIGFDVAVAAYGGSNPPAPATDDRFIVFVSRDGGSTWNINNALVFADGDADTEHNFSDLNNNFQRFVIRLVDENDMPYTGTVRFAFYGESIAYGGDNDIWVDNIIVDEWSSCPNPYDLAVSEITATSAEATFSAYGVTAWEYVVAEGANADLSTGTPNSLDDISSFDLTDMSPATTYTLGVRSVCDGETSDWATVTFTTLALPAELPYSTSFDTEDTWFVTNAIGSTVNAWAIGSATAYEEGGSAAYISNDGGESYAATLGTSATVSHLWKDFDFGETTEEFEIAFDWKGIGRQSSSSYNCYIGLFITDITPLPTTGTVGATYRYVRLAGAEDWQNERVYLGNITGQKRVIFTVYGYTDESELSIPMAIDNVNLSSISCTPADLSSVSATPTSGTTATVTWADNDESHSSWIIYYKAEDEEEYQFVTSSETTVELVDLTPLTNYEVYVSVVCDGEESIPTDPATFVTLCTTFSEFPYFESFEGDNGLGCWTTATLSYNALWDIRESVSGTQANSYASDGTKMAYHTWNAGQSARLMSPVFDLSSLTNPYIKFDYQLLAWGGTFEQLTVKYKASPESEWTELATFTTMTTGWTTDSIALPSPSASYQIGFESVGVGGYGVALDAITVYEAEGEQGGEDPEPQPCDAPTALTASNITQTTADITWTGTATSYEVRLNGAAAESVSGTTKQYTGLTANTAYTVEVRTVCEDQTSDWVSVQFTTLEEEVVVVTPPTVATLAASEITHESAVLNGTITAGSETITAQGFMYKATAAADWTTVNATGTTISATLSALTAETEYTFKAFATTATGTVEGTAMTFTTTAAPIVAPVVTTLAATEVTHESAVLNGTITAGSEEITAQGFMYKATAAADWTTVAATGETITATITALAAETEYSFKAFATTASGTVEGEVMTFTTEAAPVVVVAPEVVTLAASNITNASATLNATVTAGSEEITAQGFMYKATAAADWITVAATGENMTATVEGLEAEMAYEYKAFATTASGTVEGEVMTFTTLAGLNDAANAINAIIYPNPADDKAIISVNVAGAKIVVSDMQGRIIMSDDMTEETYDLNVANYAAGVYYIRIISGNTVNTQKLIVK